jgi:hypothetical protein
MAGPGRGGEPGTGESAVSMSASVAAFDGYEQVLVPGSAAVARQDPAVQRLRALQPTRRAVLFVRAAGDPLEPADLAEWFTERGFHFYVTGLRRARGLGRLWPVRVRRGLRASTRWARLRASLGGRVPAATLAGLDDACAHLRQAEGMAHVIVAAQGRGARAAALWCARRPAASALVLIQPALPARPALPALSIACPVLVVTGAGRPAGWRLRGHVTWLELPASDGNDGSTGPVPLAGEPSFFNELGRWLGAYMYGQFRDQLL